MVPFKIPWKWTNVTNTQGKTLGTIAKKFCEKRNES